MSKSVQCPFCRNYFTIRYPKARRKRKCPYCHERFYYEKN